MTGGDLIEFEEFASTDLLGVEAEPECNDPDADDVGTIGEQKGFRARQNLDNVELIPGLIGSGPWRRLKGGVTMDSGCSLDTIPATHAPNIQMDPIPARRHGRVINAANGTKIKEHGEKHVRFKTRLGKSMNWCMAATDVKKALKSVATTCDGDEAGEAHVLFTKHGGRIIYLDETSGSYIVQASGHTTGTGRVTEFDRTANTYGMECWVPVKDGSRAELFSRPVAAP